jgi:hypothetical protein
VLHELGDVPGKDRDEERGDEGAQPTSGRLLPCGYERGAEADLDDARPDHHLVGIDRYPGGDLRSELLARSGEVADAGGEEEGTEGQLTDAADDASGGRHGSILRLGVSVSGARRAMLISA